MTDAIELAAQPVWAARVVCGHRGALGRPETLTAWAADDDCEPSAPGGWQVGVSAATQTEVEAVLAAVATARGTADGPGLPVASLLVRVATRARLPQCSVLIADGDQLAALTWGRRLGIVELGGWEYAVTSTPPADDLAWSPLAPGTVAALDPCGPTIFPLHPPVDTEESR
ncbi:hypothetical protein [Nocardioides sp. Iso805N]|uniref:hypothetical protein n=1 Tax=Nocardioides sp. Iso805N TaxID=1283287 RepID=UPI00036EA118|nr:hypothetical protein [Nocardioides sp. Iso805N]